MKIRCKHCEGCGFVLRKEEFVCPSGKHPSSVHSCMFCENIDKGLYKECDECYGSGSVIQKKNNEKNNEKNKK
jgi:hypothetical protein